MTIKDETTTMGKTDEGVEYIAETHAVDEVTLADGTEMTAEITTTADADDPTQVEGHMTVTSVAPDGTETVAEYVAEPDGDVFLVEEESALEQFVEDTFGIEIADTLTPVTPGAEVSDDATTGVYQAESAAPDSDDVEIDSNSEVEAADFAAGNEQYYPAYSIVETADVETPIETNYGTTESGYEVAPVLEATSLDSTVPEAENAADIYTATSDTDAAELAEQEAHTDAAKDAQESADEFVAAGDYAAAAEARETAENEAYEAGDDSMLGAYDAQDLTTAGEKQEDAQYYEAREAEHAQAGDYEAAREDASNAGYAMSDADWSAGGDDHSGQADAEKYNMDNAVWQEGIAKSDVDNAEYYAESGNFDAAESAFDSAEAHQASADNYGDLGEHGGVSAVYDSSSEVETGGSYDSTYDSGYDTAAVDTTSTYDTGADDV